MRYKVINTEETVTKVTNCTILEIDDEEVCSTNLDEAIDVKTAEADASSRNYDDRTYDFDFLLAEMLN